MVIVLKITKTNFYLNIVMQLQANIFTFLNKTWKTPFTKWIKVFCNENGQITETVMSQINYGSVFSNSISNSLSKEIESGFEFKVGLEVFFINVSGVITKIQKTGQQ